MAMHFKSVAELAAFSREKMFKADLFSSPNLFVGLNCFQRGQSQKVHVHADSDKFYVVLSGKARMIVGEDRREVGEGSIVWAPADMPHGVEEALEPTIMLVAMAPPPTRVSPPAAR
jgi:quercetin dioxygenase-like cupin family protein